MKTAMKTMALTAALLAGPALADGLPEGCYVRDYSDAHLASQPQQIVDWMQLWVYQNQFENKSAMMQVRFAAQGHVAGTRHAGQVLDQLALCYEFEGGPACVVDCDGGRFQVVRDTGDAITIQTNYFMVGQTGSCGGAANLAEKPDQAVKYKLYRADARQCAGVRALLVRDGVPPQEGPGDTGDSK